MGIIASIIFTLLSIIIDPTGNVTSGTSTNKIIIDPTGNVTSGTSTNKIIIDPTGN
ncbi:MAG: hypothetical protein U0X41_12640 [Chitinophagales bacterium]